MVHQCASNLGHQGLLVLAITSSQLRPVKLFHPLAWCCSDKLFTFSVGSCLLLMTQPFSPCEIVESGPGPPQCESGIPGGCLDIFRFMAQAGN